MAKVNGVRLYYEIAKLIHMQADDIQKFTSDMSGPVTTSRENVKWSERQDSNPVKVSHNQFERTLLDCREDSFPVRGSLIKRPFRECE